MKIIITENKFKDTIKLSLNEFGTESTIDNVGGWDNFCNVMNIEGSIDFLHLFDDLDVVQSDEKENFTLFRYKVSILVFHFFVKIFNTNSLFFLL